MNTRKSDIKIEANTIIIQTMLTNMGRSTWFKTSIKVRQGSVLSSVLFDAKMNEISKRTEQKTRHEHINIIK
jgi:hypothetical protein